MLDIMIQVGNIPLPTEPPKWPYYDDRDCRNCKFCFCECGEDIVCGHAKSYEETSFGRGVNYARREGNFCGPEGRLFERRTA